MKRKNILIVALLVVSGLFATQSCKKEDPTTFVVKQAFTTPVATSPEVAGDGTVFFTGSTVDLTWASENSGGDPVKWNVYFGTGKAPALFAENHTTNSISVPVLDGVTYYWRVEIVDSRGLKTSSETFSFIPVNGLNPKLSADMSWTTNVKTAVGLDLKPEAAVDLRLLIVNKSDNSIYKVVNGKTATESYTGFDTIPDGEYLVAVDVNKTIDAGQFTKTITIDLNLAFNQLGIINENFEYPQGLTNANVCSIYRTILATVVKAGPEYTITRTPSDWSDPAVTDPALLEGTWQGYDADPSYPSQVVSAITGGQLLFDGIGVQWMENDWGEVIVTHPAIKMNFNYCANKITIPLQKIMTTTWKGDPQPAYSIQGSGTFDLSGAYPVLHIQYDFVQGGTTIAKYLGLPYFELELTLDPAGLPAKKSASLPIIKAIR